MSITIIRVTTMLTTCKDNFSLPRTRNLQSFQNLKNNYFNICTYICSYQPSSILSRTLNMKIKKCCLPPRYTKKKVQLSKTDIYLQGKPLSIYVGRMFLELNGSTHAHIPLSSRNILPMYSKNGLEFQFNTVGLHCD